MENFVYGLGLAVILYAALTFYAMHYWDGKTSLPEHIMKLMKRILKWQTTILKK